jgi:CBS domain containing-hemolysin-like protein
VDAAQLTGLIGLALLLLLSAFLSAMRAALGSARRPVLREMAERGDRQAHFAATIAEDSSRVLNTFHLANVLTHFLLAGVAIGVFLTPALEWFEARLPLSPSVSAALAYLVIVLPAALAATLLADVLPETLAQRDAERWAMALARPAQIAMVLLAPLVFLITRFRRLIPAPGDRDGAITEQEIMTLVDAGEEEGAIDLDEKEMIYSIFQLADTLAREIMVPRIDIVAVEVHTPLDKARDIIIKAGHSRIPVYEESLDQVCGLLYAKDLLSVWQRGEPLVELRSILRPALFVPESKRVPDLLRELRDSNVHLAIVIDEYGGTAGLVTMEDIVEEIVGEIRDEYDSAEEALYETVGPDEYVFDGRVNLDDFNRLLDVELPDELGDTLGGFIYGELGKVPKQGEVVVTHSLRLEVTSVVDRRIRKVRVRRIGPSKLPPATPAPVEPAIKPAERDANDA